MWPRRSSSQGSAQGSGQAPKFVLSGASSCSTGTSLAGSPSSTKPSATKRRAGTPSSLSYLDSQCSERSVLRSLPSIGTESLSSCTTSEDGSGAIVADARLGSSFDEAGTEALYQTSEAPPDGTHQPLPGHKVAPARPFAAGSPFDSPADVRCSTQSCQPNSKSLAATASSNGASEPPTLATTTRLNSDSSQAATTQEHVQPCDARQQHLPQPIMVFDAREGSVTFHARLMEWAEEVAFWNTVQSQLRLMCGAQFIPLDPSCYVVQRLLSRGGFYPQTLVSAAARFQELLLSVPALGREALGPLGVWHMQNATVVGPDGVLQVSGFVPALLTLSRASSMLRMAFVGCAYHELNRMDSGPPFTVLSVSCEAITPAPREPRYGLADLQGWLALVLESGARVGLESAREVGSLAAKSCAAVEGAVVAV